MMRDNISDISLKILQDCNGRALLQLQKYTPASVVFYLSIYSNRFQASRLKHMIIKTE